MIVLKFGGTSVAKPERIQGIISLMKDYYQRGERFTLVVSAFGGVTDQLIKMSQLAEVGDEAYKEIFEEFRDRHLEAAEALLSGDRLKTVLSRTGRKFERSLKISYMGSIS